MEKCNHSQQSMPPHISLSLSLKRTSLSLAALLLILPLCSSMSALFILLLVWVQRGNQTVSTVCHSRPLRPRFFPEALLGRGELWGGRPPPREVTSNPQTQRQKSHERREEHGHPITQQNRGEWWRKGCGVKEQRRYQSAAWTEQPGRNGCSSLTPRLHYLLPLT